MIKFILIIITLYIIISNPILIFVAAGLIIGRYLYKTQPDLFPKLPAWLSATPSNTGGSGADLSREEGDFETTEEKLKRVESEIDEMMKPGVENDPKWQESTKELNKIRAENRKVADKELHLEMLRDAVAAAEAGRWGEFHRIEQELKEFGAKS
jgi:hypothetical protein